VQLEALAYSPAQAFAVAAATLAGQSLGAGDPRQATRSVRSAVIAGIVFMTSMAIFFWTGGRWLAEFFTGDPVSETTTLTVKYLRIVSYSLPSLGIAIVLTGALRGAGDTVWSLSITFTGLALIRVPLGIYLAHGTMSLWAGSCQLQGLDWGVRGAWIAMVIDVVLRGFLLLGRYLHGGWQKVHV
jgi:Na+-driven multidrug efflux pump